MKKAVLWRWFWAPSVGYCLPLVCAWLCCPSGNAFKPGIIFGCVGIVLGIITLIIWRKMIGKAPIKVSGKTILTIVVGIIGALAPGVGICFCMVWGKMTLGIVIGLVGIVILLCLIPLTRGLKE